MSLGVVDSSRSKVCWVFDTRLQDRVEWCVAAGLLHDEREERSGDVPTGVVVRDGEGEEVDGGGVSDRAR